MGRDKGKDGSGEDCGRGGAGLKWAAVKGVERRRRSVGAASTLRGGANMGRGEGEGGSWGTVVGAVRWKG